MDYDVIIVGAGPAGSTTARECASQGLSVLMLDKAEFPRDKPCGGAVTFRARGLLPFDIRPVVERVGFGMHLTFRKSNKVTRRSEHEFTYFTQRVHLDAFLVNMALDSGAILRQRVTIREIERGRSCVVVRTAEEVFVGRALVSADGANGTSAKMAGLNPILSHGIALEGNVTPQGEFPKEWEDSMGLDVGGMPGGYGWVFPKGDHLNIGVGGWKYLGPGLRGRLHELVDFYGFDVSNLWGLRGHHLPIRRRSSPLVDGNILLVGDAGGLLDPLTGEGIYAAIWSGQVASRHLAAYVSGQVPDLQGYRREIEYNLIPDLSASRRFKDLFHLTPGFYIAAERWTSVLWGLTCRILRGEQTYTGVMDGHRTMSTFVDFFSDLVRVTPRLQRMAGLKDPAPPQRFFLRGAHDHRT